MNNICLKKVLFGDVSDNTLPKFGDLLISAKWGNQTSLDFSYGPGSGKSNELINDLDVTIIEGGEFSDHSTYKHISKGKVAYAWSALNILKTENAENIKFIINNKYKIEGFGFLRTNYEPSNYNLSFDDFCVMISVNRFIFGNAMSESKMNLTQLADKLIDNGRKKSFECFCYYNVPYNLYEGDSYVPVTNKNITVNINNDQTLYTLEIDNNVIAKRQKNNGVWTSLPKT